MNDAQQRKWMLLGVIVAVAAWGGFLALGSYLGIDRQTLSRDVRRLVIMASSSGIFLGGWLLALWLRARRQPRK